MNIIEYLIMRAKFPNLGGSGGGGAVIAPLEVTGNGTYTAPEGVDGYNPVTVNVEPVLQEKTITENGEYTPDEGYDGLGKVTVEVAGSGGGTLVAECLQFTATGKTQKLNHGLGTIPICVCFYPSAGLSTSALVNGSLQFGFGINAEIASLMGLKEDMGYGNKWNTYSANWMQTAPDYAIDSTETSLMIANNATSTDITLGSSNCSLVSGASYTVFLIGYKVTE